jgi:glycosyltransferase involved in cell wall biosynthesis
MVDAQFAFERKTAALGQEPSCAIAINGRFLTQHITGIQRFARESVKAMDVLLEEQTYAGLRGRIELLVPRGAGAAFPLRHIGVKSCGMLQGHAWEQLELPSFARGRLLLGLCTLGSLLARNQFVVVHDVAYLARPETFSLRFRLAYRAIVPGVVRRASGLAAVSEFTKSEMVRWCGAERNRIVVCGEGADHMIRVRPQFEILERHDLKNKRFLMAVGFGGSNKNLSTLFRAFADAQLGDVVLVLTGNRDTRLYAERDSDLPDFVRHVGHVSDGEMRALYETAVALVHPSVYEGFGLPPVEAMVCGCPVISSDQPALAEVAQDSTLRYPAADPAALSALMRRICEDENLRAELSRRGRERVRQFRWERTARILLDACLATCSREASRTGTK